MVCADVLFWHQSGAHMDSKKYSLCTAAAVGTVPVCFAQSGTRFVQNGFAGLMESALDAPDAAHS